MFQFEKNKRYGMPPFFGGSVFDPNASGMVRDETSLSFTFTTDEKRLYDYLPSCYTLLRPEVTIGFAQHRECDFLAGAAYNAVQVFIPVRFTGSKDIIEGNFVLVIWENKTLPILGGREDTGMPKIPADIEDLHIYHDKYFTSLSFEGNTFLRLEMFEPQPVIGPELENIKVKFETAYQLGWRYIPKIGEAGAELNQPTLYPQFFQVTSAWTASGNFRWTKQSYEQNERECGIINSLASLPVKSKGLATMCKGQYVLKYNSGRVLV